MAYSYTRQSSFSDGDTITAALFNNEYNQLVNAFAYTTVVGTTGHRHDGTAAHGGSIHTIGDLDFLNKIVADSTNNRWGVFVEVSSAAVEQIRIQDGAIVPVTDNDIDLGTSSVEFKDAFFDGTVTTDALVADTADINGGTVDGATVGANSASSGAFTTITASGTFIGSSTVQGTTITATTAFVPDASDGAALGTSALEFSDLFLADGAVINFGDDQDITLTHSADTGLTTNGTFQATTITATTAFVPDAVDGAALGTSALEFSDLFLADAAVINFGADQDVTLTHVPDAGLLLNSTMAIQFNDSSQYINAPSNAILDINATDEIELNATLVDINANVDVSGTLTVAGAVDFGDAALSNVGAVQLDSIAGDGDTDTSITFSGSNVITIKAANADQVTFIDGAIVPSSDNDIDLGTSSVEFKDAFFDGTVTSDAFAGPLTGNVTGNASGTALTVTQAAQSAITSLGTLTALTVDNLGINGNTITANSGALNLTPASGSAIVLDGTINVDAGVVTGATSITSTAFAGALTGDVTGNVSGTAATVTTAAQSNITSLGTLTTLTVDNVIINGSTIGHTGDTDLMTVASGVLTVAGEVDALTLDVSGNADIDGTLEADAITIGGTAVGSIFSPIAGGSNIVTTGALNSGSITSGFGTINNGSSAITTTGVGTFGSLDISGNADIDGTLETDALSIASTTVTATAAELNYNDTGASVGTVVASKTVTVDANKDVSSFRNITLTGELDAGSLDISGNADIDGITNLDVVDIDGAVDMASTLVVGGTFSSNISGDATYFPGYHQNTYGAQLEVAGTASNGNTLYIGRKDQTALTLGTSVTTSSTDKVANFYDTDQDVGGSPDVGAEVGSITISASSTAFNTSSDYRLKENLVGISDGITRVKQLSPKRFNFKVDSGTTVDGFIAHEVSGIVPEAINGVKDATDDNGNPSYQAIDQSKLIPLLTAALQEAISKIEALETRVAALES